MFLPRFCVGKAGFVTGLANTFVQTTLYQRCSQYIIKPH